jgi:uncharacterized zinc-type alcohol dehydrogenase-like protein
VTTFSLGDRVAVGNIVDSCGVCAMCEAGQENFCHSFPTLTYGGTDRQDGSTTLGGYSREYVVRDTFAYPLPSGLDPAAAAPLMCVLVGFAQLAGLLDLSVITWCLAVSSVGQGQPSLAL